MGLSLDAESRRAVDLAKRALPVGEHLDTALLLTALYNGTSLKEESPQLREHLSPPQPPTDPDTGKPFSEI